MPCIDCGTPGTQLCPACQRGRGTTTSRGYDAAHKRLRAQWQQRIDEGEEVHCWRPDCGELIVGTDWHLGHDDYDRNIVRGPECARSCNLSNAGRMAHAD